jgi:RNA polymerase sigma factor (sigma-70 family)
VALYPRWSKVAEAQSPIAYVRRSLINRYLNQQRSGAASELVTDFTADRAPGRRPGPDFAHRVDDRDQLRRALSTLPARQRAAVVLRYFHDLSDQQVAEAMGCRATTVRSLISRALSTLRGDAASTGLDGRSDQQGAVR